MGWSMATRWETAGALCGLASPLAFLVLYLIALAGDPDYTFFESYLSDLGVGPMALAFNTAVIVAGALTIPFAVLAVRPALDGGIAAVAGVAMTVVAASFLVLVGVFTEDYEDTHYQVSVGFFLSMLLALLCYSWTLQSSNALGREVTWLTQFCFAAGVVMIILGGFSPQTETAAVLLIVVWGLAVAAVLLWRGAGAGTY